MAAGHRMAVNVHLHAFGSTRTPAYTAAKFNERPNRVYLDSASSFPWFPSGLLVRSPWRRSVASEAGRLTTSKHRRPCVSEHQLNTKHGSRDENKRRQKWNVPTVYDRRTWLHDAAGRRTELFHSTQNRSSRRSLPSQYCWENKMESGETTSKIYNTSG